MLNIYLLTFFLSLLIAYLITPLMRKLALKFKILDYPDEALKLHSQPTPYLGGLAIYLAFIISIAVAIFLATKIETKSPKIIGILLGATIILILGLIDDLRTLSPKVKLLVEGGVSIILVLLGVKLTLVFLNPHLNIFFTVIWVVAITNAFNIIDTLDGLSCGVAFIALVILFLIALETGNVLVAIACSALAGATLGFLRYNFKPGIIFLGDAGSLFLGFIIAVLAMEENYSYPKWSWVAFLSPLLILGVPIYDTILVTILRYKKGASIVRGSKDHLAFRLLDLGLSRKEVVLLIYLITLLLGLIALIVINVSTALGIVIFLAVILILLTIGQALSKVKG